MDISSEFWTKLEAIGQWLGGADTMYNVLFFLLWLIAGKFAAQITRHAFVQLEKRIPVQVCRLLSKISVTMVWFLFLMLALSAIQVDVMSILGAAGVLGVAIGFASQTSLSNLICGIFIISEQRVKLGDYISVGGCEGTVESINLLAVELRQIDNALVRVPNQNLVQSPMINITGSTTRRCDLTLGLDYTTDLDKAKAVLLDLVEKEELFLNDPAPIVHFLEFADSTLNVRVGAWCKTENYATVRFEFARKILAAFKENNISMAFPTRTVYQAKDAE